jgi:hypothetical protein
MGFLERIEERRKKERVDLLAMEREEQRQEERRELEREQERQEERQRREQELHEAERKALEKTAAFRARYNAERRIEKSRAKRIMDYKGKLSAERMESAHSEAREAKLKELRNQELRDAQRLDVYKLEKTSELKAKLAEERKEMAFLDTNRAEYQKRRRQEHRRAREYEIQYAKQSQENKTEYSESQKEIRRSEARQVKLKERRKEENPKVREIKIGDTDQPRKRITRQSESRNKITPSEASKVKLKERHRPEKLEKRHEKRENSTRLGIQQNERSSGQRFPSGRLSGSLPWLHVHGKYLLDEMNQVVILRGVTAKGLERASPDGKLFNHPLDDVDFATLQDWGVTALVVTIAQDLALEGRDGAEGEDYLEALDATIQAAADVGIYTIIRLSLLSSVLPTGAGPENDVFDPALPDQRSIDLWAVLARRYSNESAVIFDVFRTPHDPELSDSTSFLMPRFSWSVWRHWLLAMLGEVRREHPRALIIARGPNYDLSGFPLTYSDCSQVGNVIYATEIAPNNTQQVLVEITKINRAGCLCLLDVRTSSFDGRFVEALSRILARDGINWISTDWKDGKTKLVERKRGHPIATPIGRAFQVALHVPPAPDANFEPNTLWIPTL